MFNILVLEDNAHTSKLFETILKQNGYMPFCAFSAEEALELLDRQQIDLLICDVMLPGMDGCEFVKLLRSCDNTSPVLMVSAKEMPRDKCAGLAAGADDYIGKPFDEQELLLRVTNLLKRSRLAAERSFKYGGVELNYDNYTVTGNGETVTLRKKEFQLLYFLLTYSNKVFTRYRLMDEIWGFDSDVDEHTVTVHINRLRTRFENWPQFKISTLRGVGYMGEWTV